MVRRKAVISGDLERVCDAVHVQFDVHKSPQKECLSRMCSLVITQSRHHNQARSEQRPPQLQLAPPL